MEAKVISIINYKGGVRKSTVTYNLGAELANIDKKVLLIDFDGQGNLTKFTGVENKERISANIVTMLNEIIKGQLDTKDPIYAVKDNLDIIACDIQKESWSIRALSELARETILKRYIEIIKERYNYDYILIDNAPSVNLDFQNALVASDEYLIVTEAEIASSDGIFTINSVINQIKSCFNKELKASGVVINKVQENTNFHKIMNEIINTSFGEGTYIFKTFIPKSIAVPESEFEMMPLSDYNYKNKAAIAFRKLAEEFVNK